MHTANRFENLDGPEREEKICIEIALRFRKASKKTDYETN